MLAATRSRLPAVRSVAQKRFNSTLPIPPKIATPKSVQGGGTSSRMEEVVDFYKALPKGEVASKKKATAFNPGTGKPLVAGMATLFLIGYTIDYQMHLSEYRCAAYMRSEEARRSCRLLRLNLLPYEVRPLTEWLSLSRPSSCTTIIIISLPQSTTRTVPTKLRAANYGLASQTVLGNRDGRVGGSRRFRLP